MSRELVEIVTTVASEEDARRLSRELVAAGVVACATYFPVRSFYRWKGELRDDAEFQIVGKTTADLAAEAEEHVRRAHPYETPAILRVAVRSANEAYAAWVTESVRRPDR
ncbi:MAG: divalent-cation tolerance protein CutA [Candidatus Eiseniibacteriota bacterium]